MGRRAQPRQADLALLLLPGERRDSGRDLGPRGRAVADRAAHPCAVSLARRARRDPADARVSPPDRRCARSRGVRLHLLALHHAGPASVEPVPLLRAGAVVRVDRAPRPAQRRSVALGGRVRAGGRRDRGAQRRGARVRAPPGRADRALRLAPRAGRIRAALALGLAQRAAERPHLLGGDRRGLVLGTRGHRQPGHDRAPGNRGPDVVVVRELARARILAHLLPRTPAGARRASVAGDSVLHEPRGDRGVLRRPHRRAHRARRSGAGATGSCSGRCSWSRWC